MVLACRRMSEHLSMQRLLEVAASDDLVFSLEEFNHLKNCPACFKLWSEFIYIQEQTRSAKC
jgi:predicted anti-sigma-YlaC factor YlaD